MRHLLNRRFGAIRIVNLIRVKRRAHCDLMAGEISIVMHPIHHRHTGRRINIAVE